MESAASNTRKVWMRAAEIHSRIGDAWPSILAQLGIGEEFLRKRHGPCPLCGGRDRYFFDNKHGRGDYFCRQCGAGDGFKLLAGVHRWTFSETRRRVIEAAGLAGSHGIALSSAVSPPAPRLAARQPQFDVEPLSCPPERVRRLRATVCGLAQCDDALDYLAERGLWPWPEGCRLMAHAGAEYFDDGKLVGRFPAVVAEVTDLAGAFVTLHVTYLAGGKKLATHEPRKILSALTGHEGCAVRLMPLTGPVLGVAEGIETALSAAKVHGEPVWAALNTSLLAKFEPPPGVDVLHIYADRDEPGLAAAAALATRLQGRIRFEIRSPKSPAKDWNDVLTRGSHD